MANGISDTIEAAEQSVVYESDKWFRESMRTMNDWNFIYIVCCLSFSTRQK